MCSLDQYRDFFLDGKTLPGSRVRLLWCKFCEKREEEVWRRSGNSWGHSQVEKHVPKSEPVSRAVTRLSVGPLRGWPFSRYKCHFYTAPSHTIMTYGYAMQPSQTLSIRVDIECKRDIVCVFEWCKKISQVLVFPYAYRHPLQHVSLTINCLTKREAGQSTPCIAHRRHIFHSNILRYLHLYMWANFHYGLLATANSISYAPPACLLAKNVRTFCSTFLISGPF